MERHLEIERSLIKTYRKSIWQPFIAAVKEYELIQAGDKIAVCISGGKDSMLMAKCMQELHRHSIVPFEAVYMVMDPGYNPENRALIEQNAALLHVPIEIFESNIFHVVADVEQSPCYLCARMRRGHLYSHAKKLGCNKIALGHHFDDVIETVLLSMFYGAQLQSMMPKLHSDNFEGMELIRPLFKVHEDDIIRWKNYNKLTFLQCACRFTEQNAMLDKENTSKRKEVKQIIGELKKNNPNVDKNIFHSVHNLSLDTIVRWKTAGKEHSFLDQYDQWMRNE